MGDPIYDYCIDRILRASGLLTVKQLEKDTSYTPACNVQFNNLWKRTREYLNKAVPDNERLMDISKRYGFEGFYLFTTDASELNYIAETRFFNPAFGINEDPATGTAAGPLAGFLGNVKFILPGASYRILQGVLVNHPSSIQVKQATEGIWVSGSSVIVMEGKLLL